MGTAAIFWDFAARPPFLHNYQGTKTPGTTPIDHLIASSNYLASAAACSPSEVERHERRIEYRPTLRSDVALITRGSTDLELLQPIT